MGTSSSSSSSNINDAFKEMPNEDTDASLYYFGGRGLADQIRLGILYFVVIDYLVMYIDISIYVCIHVCIYV